MDITKPEIEDASSSKFSLRLSPALLGWTGFLLIKAGQNARDILEQELAKLGVPGLRSRHCGVLVLLADGPTTQADMGKRLRIDRNSMVSVINDLERASLLERQRSPKNRSAYSVTLTVQGSELIQRTKDAGEIAEARSLTALSSEERTELRRLLIRLLTTPCEQADSLEKG